MISTDSPIEKKGKEDLLKRAPLALKVAQIIKEYKGNESYVIGIEGIWGAGKTSFINLVLENFSADEAVIKFNPWNFSNQNELIEDFFDSLGNVLNKYDNTEIKQALSKYAPKLLKQSELEFNPSISFGLFKLSAGKIKKLGGTPTLSQVRGQIDALLRKLNRKILIVIDDIDRLDKQETFLILKLVKMTANFPNTVFLMAYDREKVAERISETGISGDDYLKKIVQVSFTIPIPDKQSLRNVLFRGLDHTIKSIYGRFSFNKEEQRHWELIFDQGFGNLFFTIRDINRYISSLRLNWSVINKEDVNPVDFIAIEALRIFTPILYNTIAGNKILFLNRDDSILNFASKSKSDERIKQYEDILDNEKIVPKNLKKHIDGICRELFPQLDAKSSYGSDYERDWRRQRRICAEQKFDFYFQLNVPDDEVSEVEVRNILSSTIKQIDLKKHLQKLDKEKKLIKTIDLILDRVEEVKEKHAENLLICLWSLDGVVKDKRTGLFDLNDFSTIVSRLSYQLIAKAIPKDKNQSFILTILEKTKNIHFPLRLLSVFEEQVEKNDKDLPVDEPFIQIFSNKILEIIKGKARDGSLMKETRLDVVLFRWAKWEGKDVVEKYVDRQTKNNTELLLFLEGFTGWVYSSNEGAYQKMELKSMGEVIPIETIKERVKNLRKNKKLNANDRKLIKLFEHPIKDFFS